MSALANLGRALRHGRLARRASDDGLRMRALDHLHWAFRYFTLAGIEARPQWMSPQAFVARALAVAMLLDVCRSSVTSRLWSDLPLARMHTSKSFARPLIIQK